jgi:hypothetical protein
MKTKSTMTYPNHHQIPRAGQVNQQPEGSAEARKLLVVRPDIFFTAVQAALVLLPAYFTSTLQEVVVAAVAEVTQVAATYHVIMLRHHLLQVFAKDLRLKRFSNR